MEPLILKPTDDTPTIKLDPTNNVFLIADRSLPENAIGFYQPIFDWLEKYINNAPAPKVDFEFKLEYFNSSSAKQIAKVLLLLEKLSAKSEVLVKWYYKQDDDDMLLSGTRYSKLINIKFEFIEY